MRNAIALLGPAAGLCLAAEVSPLHEWPSYLGQCGTPFEAFADGLMFCCVMGGIRCYDLCAAK